MWRMRTVLRTIVVARRAYARLPFFEFLRDESLSARDRLAFVPCMAPFILDFGDLNRHVVRDESSTDPLQALVNLHTYEDDHHWPWYLEDLERLGYNQARPTSAVLREMYGERTTVNRLLAGKLAHMLYDATPTERLVIIEAIEETGNVLFALTAQLARRVEREEGVVLRYLGEFHLGKESGHVQHGADHGTLAAIELDEAARARCTWLVDRVFALFGEWAAELLAYARDELPATPRPSRQPDLGALGIYVAGLSLSTTSGAPDAS
jgi:hypothetical protein